MKKLVLVVDDEAPIRNVVCQFCHVLNDVECLEASTARQAIKLLKTHKVDLVISDLNMPGETGLHLLEHVRSGDRRLPFMIFSGSLVPQEEAKLLKAGADRVLSKPADSATLVRAIRDLLQKNISS